MIKISRKITRTVLTHFMFKKEICRTNARKNIIKISIALPCQSS